MNLPDGAMLIGQPLIEDYEGCILHPYRDLRGLWTIGRGNRALADGTPVTATTKPLTMAQANELLRTTLVAKLIPRIDTLIERSLTRHQGGALLSLVFNIGSTAFAHSHVLGCINRGDMSGASTHFRDWSLAAGRYCAGLARRRAAERAVWAEADA